MIVAAQNSSKNGHIIVTEPHENGETIMELNEAIVKRFCDGAGITLSEFFDREYFNDIEE